MSILDSKEELTGLTRYRFETVKKLFKKDRVLTVLQVQVCHTYAGVTNAVEVMDYRPVIDHYWRDATFADMQELEIVG